MATSHLLRRRLGGEGGFTLGLTLAVLLVLLSLGGVAIAAATGDLRLNQRTADEKRAFDAAGAGVAFVASRLTADPKALAGCGADEPAVVDAWSGTGADPRAGAWQTLRDDAQTEWVVELLPAREKGRCDPADEASLIRPDGTLRIRATGRTGPGKAVARSIVATFRRPAYLDYLWFTDFEANNPRQYESDAKLNVTTRYSEVQFNPPLSEWLQDNGAANSCAVHIQSGRLGRAYSGQRRSRGPAYGEPAPAGAWLPLTAYPAAERPVCGGSIPTSGFEYRGPFHTNDQVANQGTVPNVYGRDGADDKIEMHGYSGPAPTLAAGATLVTGAAAPQIPFPAPGLTLASKAAPGNAFAGRTEIVLNGTSMTVLNGGTSRTQSIPADGVIAATNAGACPGYEIGRPYSAQSSPATCGQLWVRGSTSHSVTLWADDDIVVNGDLRRSGDAVIGLVARNFVRVSHRVALDSGQDPNAFRCNGTNSTTVDPFVDRRIEAAILSVEQSFMVDNYGCGKTTVGTLIVTGSISQRYRGAINHLNTGVLRGYRERYLYDDRFAYRAPPAFPSPEGQGWDLVREVEQVGAR